MACISKLLERENKTLNVNENKFQEDEEDITKEKRRAYLRG
jgi:hypothetical protein